MFKLFLVSLFFTLSFAQNNPSVYSLLGDVIYNNSNDIEQLSVLPAFKEEKEKMHQYVRECVALKQEGFAIDIGDTQYDKVDYLKKLRALSKQNDDLVRMTNMHFIDAMDNNDTQTFKQLVDVNIIDKVTPKDKVRAFMHSHEEEVKDTKYYPLFKDELEKEKIEEERLKKLKEAQKRKEKYSTIERIREKDKAKQEALQKELEKMVEDKKKQIYKKQKEELQNY